MSMGFALNTNTEQAHFRRSFWKLLFVALVFYALAFAGLATSADAFLFMIVVAVLKPAWRPQLLLIAAAIQDAPGLSYIWSYILFAGISAMVIAQHSLNLLIIGKRARISEYHRGMFYLWLLAVAVVIYAVGVSWAQANFEGYPQSTRRPYLALGLLMTLMVTVGYVSAQDVLSRRNGLKLLGAAALIAATHTVLIGMIQIPFGPELYRSSGNLERVLASGQLTDAGALGIARINGPFLSPNAFGFSIMMCCLVAVVSVLDIWKNTVIRIFLLFGAVAVVLSVSKALAAFYVALGVIVYWSLVSKARFVLYASLALIGVLLFAPTQLAELLLAAFRLEGGLGAREIAWTAVIDQLSIADWLFGIGLAAWPPFFDHYAGFELSDPHMLFLSVPGTFGLAGILLYLSVLFLLAEKLLSNHSTTYARVAVLGILALLFGKDLASIPALLGNTPFTYLVWLCLSLVLLKPVTTRVRHDSNSLKAQSNKPTNIIKPQVDAVQ